MRLIVFLLFSFCWFGLKAQLSEDNRQKFDSLYRAANNPKYVPFDRASAYNRACWNSVYQDYHLGLKVSSEYQLFAAKHGLVLREISALHFKGYTELMLGKAEDAEISHTRGLELSLKNSFVKEIAQAYADLGNLKYTTGEYKEAIEYHRKSLKLAEENDFKANASRAYINLGEIYEEQGLFYRSLENFQKAKSIIEKENYKGFYSSVYEHLGDANLSINETQIAEKYYRMALNHAKLVNNKNRKVRSLKKIGGLRKQESQLDSALIYYNEALNICLKNDFPAQLASIRAQIAEVLFMQGKLDLAREAIILALKEYDQYSFTEELDEAYLIAGEIFYNLNIFDKSEENFIKCYDLSMKLKKIGTLQASVIGLGKLYKKTGRDKLALKYYEEFDSFKNMLRGENEIKEILKMELAETYKIRASADSLERQRKFERLEYQNQRSVEKSKFKYYISLGGLTLLSLALIFTAFIFFQKRKSARILKVKNETIQQALKDKEILLKEVHHRVKNNMQVVSSLLYLKSKNMPNEVAKEALLDSKKSIDSMQLSHQRMYQNGNYEQIDIIGYTKDIFQVLLTPVKSPDDSFLVDGSEMLIHVEQAQTLGFIVHELLMNSIKYAWKDGLPKKIEISFINQNNKTMLIYRDNGIGLPDNFDINSTHTFGMMIINSLVKRQLKGNIEINSNHGIEVRIEFEPR